MTKIRKVHDKFIRDLMSRKKAVEDFLRYHLDQELVDMLDFETLEIKKDTFVDHELAEHFSDILYQIKLRDGQDVKIYVLIEHKSYSDYLVAFQLLRYMVKIWELELKQQEAERKKKKKEKKLREKKLKKESKEKEKKKSKPQEKLTLTPILPIVFYHGSQEWKVPLNFHGIFNELPSLLVPYVPDYRYFLYDLTKVKDSEIQGDVMLRIGLLSLKYALHDDLPEKLDEIFALFDQLPDHQAAREYLETLVRYLSNVKITTEELKTALKKKFSEEGETLMTTIAETLIEQGRQEGRAEMVQEVQLAHQKAQLAHQEAQAEKKRGLLSSIELGLELKFGEEGLRLFNEVQQIQETSLLSAIRAALRFVSDLGELRSIYQQTPATS